MPYSNKWPLFAGVLTAVWSFWSSAALAQQVTVTLDQANALARQAFLEKNYAVANQLTYGVLQQRPNDPAALVMAAATDPVLGQAKRGRLAGRRAFGLATDPTLKYEAAYFAASAATQEERYNAAKYWLRRAYQIAPDDQSRAQVSKIFQAVRQRSPLSVQLNFNISPSSNINNGSREETTGLNLFGGGMARLSVDAQALSGIEYRGAAAFQYRLSETNSTRTFLNFGLDARYYSLSSSSEADLQTEDDARETAGQARRNIRAADFNFETIYAGLRHQLVSDDKRRSTTYGVSFGQSWYGGSPLERFAGVSVNGAKAVSQTTTLRYGMTAQRKFRLDSSRNSSNVIALSGGWGQVFEGAGALNLGAYVRDTNSESNEIDNTAVGLTLSYRLERPVFANTQMEVSLGLQRAEYETSAIYGDREDDRLTASSTLIFSDFSYFGFSPTATLNITRTNSTVDRFSTDTIGVNLGLRSSF